MRPSRFVAPSFLLVACLFAADALAQDCGAIPDGTEDPENACSLCVHGVLTRLPPRTACGQDRRILCDATTAWRFECILSDSADPDGPTKCEENLDRFPTGCPGGLVCDEGAGACFGECTTTADCADGFECDGSICRPVDMPCPGARVQRTVDGVEGCFELCEEGVCLAGSECRDDVCVPVIDADMGGTDDMGSADVGAGTDAGAEDSGGSPPGKVGDGGGCAVASGSRSIPAAVVSLLLALVLGRRRG